ncbi:plasminogen-binding N-terminal domain-containing protein [Sulfurimonas sp.]
MKYILLLTILAFELFGALIKSPVVSVDNENETVKIKIDNIDVGVSGFIVHHISPEHSAILKNAVVQSFDAKTKTATVKMSEFTALQNNALPHGKWQVSVGDTVELAFGYSRSLLIAPNEKIYYKIAKSVQTQWIHPDLFATILSFRGHPTPIKEDFEAMADASSIGLLFIYLDQKVYTLDIKSFKILNISEAKLKQTKVHLPFYTRVDNIDAAWWGAGSSRMQNYAPHYYELMVENNKTNKQLYKIIKNGDAKLHYLLDEFEIGK